VAESVVVVCVFAIQLCVLVMLGDRSPMSLGTLRLTV